MVTKQQTQNLLSHMHSFRWVLDGLKIGLFSGVTLLTVHVSLSAINASLCSNGNGEAKRERVARMRRLSAPAVNTGAAQDATTTHDEAEEDASDL